MAKSQQVAITPARGGVAPHGAERGLVRMSYMEVEHWSRDYRRKSLTFEPVKGQTPGVCPASVPVAPSQLLLAVSPPLSTISTALYKPPGVSPAPGKVKFTASQLALVLTSSWEPSNNSSL